ncbi:hypothetical protein F5883DRAFT_655153 [Diaporthe sp. PMI_573]|nr:hypothetical protein F5883DRAFT_655153 [Diaporthaceae sp. PMI_573]
MLGAAHVTSSDGSEEVVEKLADNFSLNSLDWDYNVSSSSCLRPKLLKWGHALVGTKEPDWNGGQKVDLLIPRVPSGVVIDPKPQAYSILP